MIERKCQFCRLKHKSAARCAAAANQSDGINISGATFEVSCERNNGKKKNRAIIWKSHQQT